MHVAHKYVARTSSVSPDNENSVMLDGPFPQVPHATANVTGFANMEIAGQGALGARLNSVSTGGQRLFGEKTPAVGVLWVVPRGSVVVRGECVSLLTLLLNRTLGGWLASVARW
jgi:hypothetical protein